MIVTVAPAAKWGWPAAVFAATGLLALDGTQVSIAAVGAAQALVIAHLGYRQFRDQTRQQSRQAELERDTTENTARISGQDRLIDQLQELSGTDRQLIAVLQREVGNLNAEVLRLNRQVLSVTTGAMRLVAQLRQHNMTPVWTPEGPPEKQEETT